MAADTEVRKSTASWVLAHPVRVRILTRANESEISPSVFVEETMDLTPHHGKKYENALSHVSYHFRELLKAGCIEIVELIPRRGSFEHVYAGTARAEFTEEEWAALSQEKRCRISTVALQGMIARIERAMLAHTFDARPDRCLGWTTGELDERGWSEMTEAIRTNYESLERIREESEARLQKTDGEPIPVTYGVVGFESPPPAR